ERIRAREVEQELLFALDVVRLRERERNAEVVEEMHERRLATLRQLDLVESHEDVGERARVVERPVRSADIDAIGTREILETPARRHQLARKRQRVEGAEPAKRARETTENLDVVR